MTDDEEEPVRLYTTKPPPGESADEAVTVIGTAPAKVLAMVRPEADEERASGAPTVRPAPYARGATRGWPPIVSVGLLLSIAIAVLALVAR